MHPIPRRHAQCSIRGAAERRHTTVAIFFRGIHVLRWVASRNSLVLQRSLDEVLGSNATIELCQAYLPVSVKSNVMLTGCMYGSVSACGKVMMPLGDLEGEN